MFSPLIRSDEHRIMQVLLGLQSNALKFTEKGSVNIQVMMLDNGENLTIKVIDTGIGIPKEHQDKLFKLFGFVQDTKKLNIHGVGLGLNISLQIVEKFSGQISFESKEDMGSTFEFSFKLDSHEIDEN